jgi:hypothetical protein
MKIPVVRLRRFTQTNCPVPNNKNRKNEKKNRLDEAMRQREEGEALTETKAFVACPISTAANFLPLDNIPVICHTHKR